MGRRPLNRCRRRGPREAIPQTVEVDLTLGHCFSVGGWEMMTIRDIAAAWRTWGDEITTRWMAAYPGSRPFAMYTLGLIPPCQWQHANPAVRHPLRRIAGCVVAIPDASWHNTPREAEHLAEIGVVDADEYAAAVARFAGCDPTAPSAYQALADDRELDAAASVAADVPPPA